MEPVVIGNHTEIILHFSSDELYNVIPNTQNNDNSKKDDSNTPDKTKFTNIPDKINFKFDEGDIGDIEVVSTSGEEDEGGNEKNESDKENEIDDELKNDKDKSDSEGLIENNN